MVGSGGCNCIADVGGNCTVNTENSNTAINDVHGGNLEAAASDYGVPLDQWLDLSTGIAPWCYPELSVPNQVWQRLPHGDAELLRAAADYYSCPETHIVSLSGSQQAIATIPRLFDKPCRVAVPELGYFEHRKAWQAAGHQLVEYKDAELTALVAEGQVDAVVAINPNNPTGFQWRANDLLDLREQLHRRGGLLLVDEAFADSNPQNSLAGCCPLPGLLVLRSIGKFFGLAGLRLGFALGDDNWSQCLRQALGCWHVNGPAQWIGARLLSDSDWQLQQRSRIEASAELLFEVLQNCFGDRAEVVSTQLFVRVQCDAELGESVFERLAQSGILIRRFGLPTKRYCLRFGLPADDVEQQRLQSVLKEIIEDDNHA